MKSTLKKIYGKLPFKKQLFSFVKLFFTPGERLARHLTFNGIFSTDVKKGKKMQLMNYGYRVENTIFWNGIDGCWEKESLRIWTKLCEKSATVVDVGANTGIYAILAKIINPTADVHAFEPVPAVFDKLVKNVKLNSLDIHCNESALSDFDGSAKIFPISEEHVYSVTVNQNMYPADVPVFETEIRAQKLSTYIRENKISKIDLMKIDVETHEPEMLDGMDEYLRQWKPSMLIEILNDQIAKRVEAMVGDLSYLYFNIDELGAVKQVKNIGKSDYYNYLLCSAENAKFLNLI